MEEVWVPIKGYEGIYEVSSRGNVKSLEKLVLVRNGFYRNAPEKILRPGLSKNGYLTCSLNKLDGGKTFYIHTLVSVAFLRHKPDGFKLVVNHINGVKTDNRLENLEIVTNRQNTTSCFHNRKNKCSSKYMGVCFDKSRNKWMSYIQINGKNKFLGRFLTEKEAADSYKKALLTL